MSFSIGDNVQVVNPDSVAYQLPGKITNTHLLQGTYEVSFDKGQLWLNASELELITTLVAGKQPLLGADWMPESNKETVKEPECDCGGFKVYGVIPASAHSPWCSIFNKN